MVLAGRLLDPAAAQVRVDARSAACDRRPPADRRPGARADSSRSQRLRTCTIPMDGEPDEQDLAHRGSGSWRRGAGGSLAACGGDSLEKSGGRLDGSAARARRARSSSAPPPSPSPRSSPSCTRSFWRTPATRRSVTDGEEPRAVRTLPGEGRDRRRTGVRGDARRIPQREEERAEGAEARRLQRCGRHGDGLKKLAEPRGLKVLAAGEAVDQNAFAVSKEFAEKNKPQDPFRSRQVEAEGQDRGGRRMRGPAVLRSRVWRRRTASTSRASTRRASAPRRPSRRSRTATTSWS